MAIFGSRRSVPGQDPWVVPMDDPGHYLLVQSVADTRIVGWEFRGNHFVREYVLWEPPCRSDHGREVWAPELHYIDGTYYIYFTATDSQGCNHRMYALESRNLTGPYREVGRVCDPDNDVWAIDLTTFEQQGRRYAVWSGWDGLNDEFPQRLYIAPMSDPITISGQRHALTEPTLPWEMSQAEVVEGPQVHLVNGRLIMLYAADASWTTAYSTGALVYNGGPILSAASWDKLPQPLIAGGGHGMIVTLDERDWLVYHRKATTHPGWADRIILWTPLDAISLPLPLPVALPVRESVAAVAA